MLYSKPLEEKLDSISDDTIKYMMIVLGVAIIVLALMPELRTFKVVTLMWLALP